MLTSEELVILRKPEVQKYIREKMGRCEAHDLLWCDTGYGFIYASEKCASQTCHGCNHHLIRIPDCISRDSVRPERGLIGMLDNSWEIIKPCLSDKWIVRCLNEQIDQGPDALTYTQRIS